MEKLKVFEIVMLVFLLCPATSSQPPKQGKAFVSFGEIES